MVKTNVQYGIENGNVDENKLIAIALEKLPEKYCTVFSTLSVTLGDVVDLETFEDAVGQVYCTSNKKTSNDNNDDELNLASVNNNKKRSGNTETTREAVATTITTNITTQTTLTNAKIAARLVMRMTHAGC